MKQELIWELMKQARELAYAEHTAKCLKEGLDPERTAWSVTGARYEKFAELIVAECVAQCWTVSEMEHKGNILSECSKRMRKHFGVEE